VLDYITKLDSDVFCLQEVNRNMATFITGKGTPPFLRLCLPIKDALNIKQGRTAYDFIWRRVCLPTSLLIFSYIKRNQKGVEDGSATIYRKDLLRVVKSFMLYYENRTHIMLCTYFQCIVRKTPQLSRSLISVAIKERDHCCEHAC